MTAISRFPLLHPGWHWLRRPRAALTLGLGLTLVLAGAASAEAAPPTPAAGTVFELVTTDEAQRDLAASGAASVPEPPQRMRSLRQTVPLIEVLAPAGDGRSVDAPLRIELAFKPAPGSRVRPETFRAWYGVLKIDLTERLVRHGQITESGLTVERANMPSGLHRFVLQIADDQGKLGEQELRVRVQTP